MLSSNSLLHCAALTALGAMALLVGAHRAGAQQNLVANGDFAQTAGERPAAWEAAGDAQHVTQSLAVVRDQGRRAARLTCTRFEGAGGAVHAMLAQVGHVRLEAGRLYELSFEARQSDMTGRGISAAIQDTATWTNCGLERDVSPQERWRSFRLVFRATRSVDRTSRLQIWYRETGTLYVANVRLVEVPAGAVSFTDVVPRGTGRNLVPNGSFAAGAAGWMSLGVQAGWGNLAHLHGRVVTDGTAPYRTFLRIAAGGGRSPVLAFDYLRPTYQPQTRVLAASTGWIPVRVGTAYTLSCAMRAKVPGARAALLVVARNPGEPAWSADRLEKRVALTREWQRCSVTVRPRWPYVYVGAGPDLERDAAAEVDVTDVQFEAGEAATSYSPRLPIEVGVETSEPGGVCAAGEAASLIVRAANHTTRSAIVPVKLAARDYFDRPVPMPVLTLHVPASGTAQRKVPVPPGWRGFYRVQAQWGAGPACTAQVRLAVVPRQEARDTVLGLNHAFPDGWLMGVAARAGVTWYRDWSLKWQDLEPSPGRFDWAIADPQIDRVAKAGLHPLCLMPPFPSAEWNSEAPPGGDRTGYPAMRIRQAAAPKDPAALGAFVERTVARYRDRVRVWEFLNEPLYTDYALPGGRTAGRSYGPADYVSLLRVAAAAVRRADPVGKLIGGVASGPEHLTREVFDAGLLPLIDILNLHMYPGGTAPESFEEPMRRLQTEMARRGATRPIWVTEFSYYGVDDLPRQPFVPSPNDWAEARLLADERECAEYTVRFILVMLAHGAEKVFIHSGASGEVNAPNPECCLFAPGGAPRRVLPALGVLTSLLGARPRAAAYRVGATGVRAAGFECGGRAVVAVWSPGRDARLTPLPAGVRVLDVVGAPIHGQVTVGSAPVYLVAPAGRAARVAAAASGSR